MSDRRLTNREVALVLRRAVELEEVEKSATAKGGMTIEELQEIAREVGIDPELVSQAIVELGSRRGLEPRSPFGPPVVRKEIRAVPAELSKEALRELIRIVDSTIQSQGNVSEALGSIRWNSSERLLNSQISLEPGEGETLIRVEERFKDRLRYMLHLIPGSYGAIFSAFISAGVGLPLAPAILLGALGGVSGLALGGGIWRLLSKRSSRRVKSLIRKLSNEASKSVPPSELEKIPEEV